MKRKRNGFVISTTLYGLFGIMLITVFYILYILGINRMTVISSTEQAKYEIENYEQKKVYVNFLGPQSKIDKITDTKINDLKSELKKQGIYLVTDKSYSDDTKTTNSSEIVDRSRNIIAEQLDTYNFDYYGADSTTSYSSGASNVKVFDNILVTYAYNNSIYGDGYTYYRIYDIDKLLQGNKSYIISKSTFNGFDSLGYAKNGYYGTNPELCFSLYNAYDRKYSHIVYDLVTYKTLTSNGSSESKSGRCPSSYVSTESAYISDDIGNYYSTSALGGLYIESINDTSILLKYNQNIGVGGTTINVRNANSSIDFDMCRERRNSSVARHMCVSDGYNDYLVLNKSTPTSFSSYYSGNSTTCKNGSNECCTYTESNHEYDCDSVRNTLSKSSLLPKITIGRYTDTKRLWTQKYDRYDLSDYADDIRICEDLNDVCINYVDDILLPNIGENSITIEYRTSVAQTKAQFYKISKIDKYDSIIKYKNKLGIIIGIGQRVYGARKTNLSGNYSSAIDEEQFTNYILWIDEFTKNSFAGNRKIRTFNDINTTNKDQEQLNNYDKEYYIFITDSNKDSSGISRIEIGNSLNNRINKNPKVTSMLFSTDSEVKSAFPLSITDELFKNENLEDSTNLNTVKDQIINDIAKLDE